ncbi:PEGA domain-containing protein [candidate division WOR-3 bacterium]|uniref:PEGA domain-containing protein n=1 Tax=candidate division WOR-3 bacterium TaxID=2052148 RepID=A0A9D5QCU8_UNCW3|nr:PEGA domain-containing protein [candidate division WOR-3 bacterium]MBD3365053.1 PEGA domain-containing protein [candidate division WOR-3 bacterium]
MKKLLLALGAVVLVFGMVVCQPSTGDLAVNSTPAGATIWLNDTTTNQTTNHVFTTIEVGTYDVKLVLDGYADYTETVEVKANETVTVDAQLQTGQGSIQVNSTPDGAAITLDGESTGEVTDALIEDVESGEHTVELSLAGFADTSVSVTVPVDETVTLDVILDTSDVVPIEVINDEDTPVDLGFRLKAGQRIAVMVELEAINYPFTLTEACYVPTGWEDDPDNWDAECDLVFFTGSAQSGPATEAGRKSVSATQELEANWFDVSDLNITVESGALFFAVENKVDDNPVIAMDGGSPLHHLSWMYSIFGTDTDPSWSPFDNINTGSFYELGDTVDAMLRVKGLAAAAGYVTLTPAKIGPDTYEGWPKVQLPAEMMVKTYHCGSSD